MRQAIKHGGPSAKAVIQRVVGSLRLWTRIAAWRKEDPSSKQEADTSRRNNCNFSEWFFPDQCRVAAGDPE